MKKCVAIFAAFVIVSGLLLSCGYAGSYDDGYEDGYNDGYDEGWYEGFDDGCDIGYSDGYYEGSDEGWTDNIEEIGRFFEEEAVDYVIDRCEWHPEEAWMVIESYQNNEPFYKDGTPPSDQDYLDAVDSLICFYDYFYGRNYE